MRLQRAFRPSLSDNALEDRVVLSQSGAGTSLEILLDRTIPLPASVQGTQPVQAAFQTFVNRYLSAVTSVLLAPGADGTINPAANLAAFEAAVATDLQALDRDLVAVLASSPATSTLVPGVQQAILGNTPGGLQSRLTGITASFAGQVNPIPVYAASSVQTSQEAAGGAVVHALAAGRPLVTQGDSTQPFPVVGGLRTSKLTQASQRIRHAFDTFLQSYFSDVNNVLLAPGANAQANRAAFDAQVAAALDQLDAHLAQILRDLHASGLQMAQVHQGLVGAGAESLRGQLAALPTPTEGSGTTLQVLSAKLIARSLAQASGIVATLVPGLR